MNIAIIAHDSKKELMIQFCIAYYGTFAKHTLFATGLTGKLVEEPTKLKIKKFLNGDQGGVQQIMSLISCNEIDVLFFFRDPFNAREASRTDDINILHMCDKHNIPLATNIATGEALIHALERGDLDWRVIERENNKPII
ncbi:MAG: methylglyoxal synthase [Oscillospiraceae bacterium]|nr:methylglyoxal synthase [Oscillospiraceae bacterium]